MAVKVTNGQIWSGTISKKIMPYLYGKFHTCIKNSTGLVLCRSTKSIYSINSLQCPALNVCNNMCCSLILNYACTGTDFRTKT